MPLPSPATPQPARRVADQVAQVASAVKAEHQIRVRRWRKSMSGCAWQATYADGSVIKWVESPLPKSPLSLSIFLHEVGHHAIGFDTYKLRCEEELRAWQWSLAEMRRRGVAPDKRTLTRFERSMRYAVAKAMRRGIKRLPDDLAAFAPSAAAAAAQRAA